MLFISLSWLSLYWPAGGWAGDAGRSGFLLVFSLICEV